MIELEDDAAFDGLSGQANGNPFIVLNARMPTDRKHLVALERELGTKCSEISLFEHAALKRQYGLSMQAIMYRAVPCGVISDYSYEQFSKMISAKGWRKIEPVTYPVPEQPRRFKQLLHRALSEDLISISKAAYLGRMSIGELRQERELSDMLSLSSMPIHGARQEL